MAARKRQHRKLWPDASGNWLVLLFISSPWLLQRYVVKNFCETCFRGCQQKSHSSFHIQTTACTERKSSKIFAKHATQAFGQQKVLINQLKHFHCSIGHCLLWFYHWAGSTFTHTKYGPLTCSSKVSHKGVNWPQIPYIYGYFQMPWLYKFMKSSNLKLLKFPLHYLSICFSETLSENITKFVAATQVTN